VRAAAAIPVGPGDHELERLSDLVDSLHAHVPDLDALVLLDDAPEPRELRVNWDPDRLALLRTPGTLRSDYADDRMAAGTLTILRWLSDAPVDYLVKLDTDALVIGDFRRSLSNAMARNPGVGVWGAYRENEPGGGERDFSYYAFQLRLARLPLRPRRGGIEQAVIGPAARSRRFVRNVARAAAANGYQPGEHCLGGSYAVTRPAAERMRALGFLDDPHATFHAHLAEDVVVGLLARASGFRLASHVARGQAFALRFRGLLAEPEELLGRGHSIVHSLKDHDGSSEGDLRARFRRARV
jgi:hypothetical protein